MQREWRLEKTNKETKKKEKCSTNGTKEPSNEGGGKERIQMRENKINALKRI